MKDDQIKKPSTVSDPSQDELDDELDNQEWTAEDFANARPFAEVFPALAASIRRARGRQKAPTKVRITLRLDEATIAAFKATGAGWQTRMDEALKRVAPKG